MGWIAITASDALATSMIGVVFLGMSVVLLIFLCIRKAASRVDPEVESLLEEVAEAENRRAAKRAKPGNPKKPPPAEPWEKDGDWWKKA